METVEFKAGENILREGDEGNTAFLITTGTVEISVGEGAAAKKLGVLEAGEVFGEMSLLEPGPRSASVTALTDTECVQTSYDEFMASMQDDPASAVEFMKTLVRRLRQVTELLAELEPRKRGFREILKDWRESLEETDEELTDEDRQRRYELSMLWGPML